MKTNLQLLLALVASLLLCLGVARGQDKPKMRSLSGTVSDTTCGAKHKMMPGKSDAECTRGCVSKGSKYALVAGQKVYALEGKSEELDKLAGKGKGNWHGHRNYRRRVLGGTGGQRQQEKVTR